MDVSKKEYSKMAGDTSPASPIWKDMFMAFIFGGLICTIGQFLNQLYMTSFSLDKKTAGTWVSITLIALSSILTALNWYSKIAKYAGAGTIVPITGFSNSITAPAIEFKSEGHVFGIGAKMFIMAGPVIVFGTVASMVYGLIVWIFHLY
jgi:stage V sporulation protein AC